MKNKKAAPKGYHYMPNGKLMKDSAMSKTSKPKVAKRKKANSSGY